MQISENVTKKFGRTVLSFKKQSPHIFFGVGLVGSIASTVLACKATLQLSDRLDEIKSNLQNVHELHDLNNGNGSSYSDTQYKKDLSYVYLLGGMDLAKLYGPSIIVGAVSISALTGSHVQLTRRNTALMAAYTILHEAYSQYRQQVREELGDDKELKIYRSAIEKKLGDGKELSISDPNRHSVYAVLFDEYSPNWEKDPELNRLFIQCQQNYANNLLRAKGHLFLNEVYDMLGVDRTSAGAVVGWVIGHEGDNFVDFGIFERESSRFVNGTERSILLDFNVDGVIYDKI